MYKGLLPDAFQNSINHFKFFVIFIFCINDLNTNCLIQLKDEFLKVGLQFSILILKKTSLLLHKPIAGQNEIIYFNSFGDHSACFLFRSYKQETICHRLFSVHEF